MSGGASGGQAASPAWAALRTGGGEAGRLGAQVGAAVADTEGVCREAGSGSPCTAPARQRASLLTRDPRCLLGRGWGAQRMTGRAGTGSPGTGQAPGRAARTGGFTRGRYCPVPGLGAVGTGLVGPARTWSAPLLLEKASFLSWRRQRRQGGGGLASSLLTWLLGGWWSQGTAGSPQMLQLLRMSKKVL